MDEQIHHSLQPKKAKICNKKMLNSAVDAQSEEESCGGEEENIGEQRAEDTFTILNDGCGHDGTMDSSWYNLPEPVLTRILWLLPIKDMTSVSATCRRWFSIANDDFLWKQKLQKHFKIDPSIDIKPGAESWKSEYVRLRTHIPFIQTQCLNGHNHQVLHVSFSHNGQMFATCSKDGFVIIWNAGHPCTEKYSHNMKKFNWKYTQYSQFNQSDTLLLVSGVHFGSPHSTSGEIAVFTVDSRRHSKLRCRVINRPYDIFGTWFSDQYLISGDLHWLAQMVSTSVLWLNKANQEIDSEHVPIMYQLYKFYNQNASSVRAIMMAKCPWLDNSNDPLPDFEKQPYGSCEVTIQLCKEDSAEDGDGDGDGASGGSSGSDADMSVGNSLSNTATLTTGFHFAFEGLPNNEGGASGSGTTNRRADPANPVEISHCPGPIVYNLNDSTIHYLEEYRTMRRSSSTYSSLCDEDYDDEMENSIPKYLIFSTGSKTYTPHKVGIKRIGHVTFPKKLDPGPSLKERIAARKAAEQQVGAEEPNWWNYSSVADRFDKVDKVIDLHGHIIGMALSPDHRYLYVNTRPWPKNYVITNALEPPPIAQEIDIHVIDLMTLKPVGNMLKAHKAYTPSTECFFIFLDVCDDYVASGAEDMHAYLWDRYYGISLAKYKHIDVVNSVAFNPKDSEMLVTTSDDYTIKIWRSRAKVKEYNIDTSDHIEAFDLKSSNFK